MNMNDTTKCKNTRCQAAMHAHASGLCRRCRWCAVDRKNRKELRLRRKAQRVEWGSQQWAETYTDDRGE